MNEPKITPPVSRTLWREDFDAAMSRVIDNLKRLRSPEELQANLGRDWYQVNLALTIAGDALWLARDVIEFGARQFAE